MNPCTCVFAVRRGAVRPIFVCFEHGADTDEHGLRQEFPLKSLLAAAQRAKNLVECPGIVVLDRDSKAEIFQGSKCPCAWANESSDSEATLTSCPKCLYANMWKHCPNPHCLRVMKLSLKRCPSCNVHCSQSNVVRERTEGGVTPDSYNTTTLHTVILNINRYSAHHEEVALLVRFHRVPGTTEPTYAAGPVHASASFPNFGPLVNCWTPQDTATRDSRAQSLPTDPSRFKESLGACPESAIAEQMHQNIKCFQETLIPLLQKAAETAQGLACHEVDIHEQALNNRLQR